MQEINGDDDAIDTSIGMTEVDEGVGEGQEITLKTAGDVTMEGNPVDKDGSGDVMANETLVAVMADEATLVMADEAYVGTVHETALVMADETSVGMEMRPQLLADLSLTIGESVVKDSNDQDANFVDSEEKTSNEPSHSKFSYLTNMMGSLLLTRSKLPWITLLLEWFRSWKGFWHLEPFPVLREFLEKKVLLQQAVNIPLRRVSIGSQVPIFEGTFA